MRLASFSDLKRPLAKELSLALSSAENLSNSAWAGRRRVDRSECTVFYAEKGGQVGDTGTLSHHDAHFAVTDCHTPYSGVVVHIGRLEKGSLIVGEPVSAELDLKKRQKIENNHTATHLPAPEHAKFSTFGKRDQSSTRADCALTSATTRRSRVEVCADRNHINEDPQGTEVRVLRTSL